MSRHRRRDRDDFGHGGFGCGARSTHERRRSREREARRAHERETRRGADDELPLSADERAWREVNEIADAKVEATSEAIKWSVITIALLIYKQAFTSFDFGGAAAMGVILSVVILAVSLVQFRFFGGWRAER